MESGNSIKMTAKEQLNEAILELNSNYDDAVDAYYILNVAIHGVCVVAVIVSVIFFIKNRLNDKKKKRWLTALIVSLVLLLAVIILSPWILGIPWAIDDSWGRTQQLSLLHECLRVGEYIPAIKK